MSAQDHPLPGAETEFAIRSRPAARDWRSDEPAHVLDFHRSIPGYAPTRLVELPALARELGAARVWVKEEAHRYGLPAFKMLGAAHAVARALSARLGVGESALPLSEIAARLPETGVRELVAATDGNHGRAVARTGALVGLPARIFLPGGVSEAAVDGIRAEDAEIVPLGGSYDAAVARAAEESRGAGSLLIQDTSWEGYEEVPAWIVEGYGSVLEEAAAQLREAGAPAPTLVTAPTGVGAFAEAVVRFTRSGGFASGTAGASDAAPHILAVEPSAAPSLFASLLAGQPVTVQTGNTIMAGLNCGTVAAASWPALRDGVDLSAVVPDAAVTRAVRDLEAHGVDSGPCGAASLAGVRLLRERGMLADGANILLISTEGRAANPLPAAGISV